MTLRARSKGQPVPDLTAHSTPAEHAYDRALAREDRLNDMADRDLCAAVENLRRTQSQPQGRRLPPPASGAGCAPGVIHNEEAA